jgi:hypothetical protein
MTYKFVFSTKGDENMDKNPSIQCVVSECKYHACQEDYCTLNQIRVGKHQQPASDVKATDCESFEVK